MGLLLKPGSQGLVDAGFKSSIKRSVRPTNLPKKVLEDIYKIKNPINGENNHANSILL